MLGPTPVPGATFFRVWAPLAATVAVRRVGSRGQAVALAPEGRGYFSGPVAGLGVGDCYTYLLDGRVERPDPASRCQPEGVHGPSQILDPGTHRWADEGWQGRDLADFIIYELHVGTFSRQGTFAGVEQQLDALVHLGITAVELMPVAQFPGSRNWGYDGVYPYAVQTSYGGSAGLKSLVDACHQRGLAVILDVVYNHLGPEGNVLHAFGPYFTDRHRTPWGEAFNFDGPDSHGVRDYVIGNALFWIEEHHIDALRLDAVHGIFDFGSSHILDLLRQAVHHSATALGRRVQVIAESDLNDSRLIRPGSTGGYGLDAQWNDDFHHALHALLTGERQGYYQDFGDLAHLQTAIAKGYVYGGDFSPYRQRRHGNDASDLDPVHFVVFAQNHDQIGNRRDGDRLTRTLDLEPLKLVAGVVLLSPFLPLLFMGEEYGETAPFHYFVSHGDADLIAAVRHGRRMEFAAAGGVGEGADPQDEATFHSCRPNLDLRHQGDHALLHRLHRALIGLRKAYPCLGSVRRDDCRVSRAGEARLLLLVRDKAGCRSLCLFNFATTAVTVELPGSGTNGWDLLLDSAAGQWGGPRLVGPAMAAEPGQHRYQAAPLSVAVFVAGQP